MVCIEFLDQFENLVRENFSKECKFVYFIITGVVHIIMSTIIQTETFRKHLELWRECRRE